MQPIAKNSESLYEARVATPAAPPPFRGLTRVTHYHQPAGRQPGSRLIESGREMVELVTGGRCWVRHQDRWVPLMPGALLWHINGDRTIGRSDPGDPYRCLAVEFQVARRRVRRVPRITWWRELDEIQRFTYEAVRAFVDEWFDRETLGIYLFGRLLFQARLHGRRSGPEDLPEPLRRVLQQIETRYAEPLPMEELAREAGWSVPHLHAVTKEKMGRSPHQLLIQRRLQAARVRLAASRDPVKQIAVECGFGSAGAFCHLFRKATGQTPANYRNDQWRLFRPAMD